MKSNLKFMLAFVLVLLAICFGMVLMFNNYNFAAATEEGYVMLSPDETGMAIGLELDQHGKEMVDKAKQTLDSLQFIVTRLEEELQRKDQLLDSLSLLKKEAPTGALEIIRAYESTLSQVRSENDSLRQEIKSRDTLITLLRNQVNEMANWMQFVKKEIQFAHAEMFRAQGYLNEAYQEMNTANMFNRKRKFTAANSKFTAAKEILEGLKERLAIEDLFSKELIQIDQAIEMTRA